MFTSTITVEGHLAREPTVLENLTEFVVLTNRRKTDEAGEWVTAVTSRFTVKTFRTLGTMAGEQLHKGDQVIVAGSIVTDTWKDTDTDQNRMVEGYANMLTTAVPLAPSADLCNMTICLQQQTEWISGAIQHVRESNTTVIEPTRDGEDAWIAHHEETASVTLVPKTHPWYMDSNVPGKPRRLLSYIGGVGQYRDKCDEEVAAGYPAFRTS